LRGADQTLASAQAELEGGPEKEIERLNARELIAVEEGRVLIGRKAYSEARKVLLKVRSKVNGNRDTYDRVSASCEILLAAIPRVAQRTTRVSTNR
jgi:hypothetical protein